MASRASPRWPRTLRAKAAAEYAGYPSDRLFLAAVTGGEMPPPFLLAGANAWDIGDLDAAVDAIKAGARRAASWQMRAPARV